MENLENLENFSAVKVNGNTTKRKIQLKFLFSHFFMVLQKVLWGRGTLTKRIWTKFIVKLIYCAEIIFHDLSIYPKYYTVG